MKILVVDDDDVVRLFLRRLCAKKFSIEILEGMNGAEGLALAEKEHPDIVLLDVTMPVMDGVEFLEKFRSQLAFQKTPVLVMTAVSEKSIVGKLVALGISGYLLKPLMLDTTQKRIGELLEKITPQQKVSATIAAPPKKQKLLIIEKDAHFRSVIRTALSAYYTVLEAENGTDGVQQYIAEIPALIYLGEGLTHLNEKLVAQKIRGMYKENLKGIFLFSDKVLDDSEKKVYSGTIKKQLISESFLKTFTLKIFGDETLSVRVLHLIANQLTPEFAPIVCHMMEALTKENVVVVNDGDVSEIPLELSVITEMCEPEKNVCIAVGMSGATTTLSAFAGKETEKTEEKEHNADAVLCKIITSITDALCIVLEKNEIKFQRKAPVVYSVPAQIPSLAWKLQRIFQCSNNEKFVVGIAVQ